MVSWEELSTAVSEWTKIFFGPHVKATFESEHEQNNILIHFSGFTSADQENFKKMFSQFDTLKNWWDGRYEFETEVKGYPHGNYILPASVTAGLLYHIVSEETTACIMPAGLEDTEFPDKVAIADYCTCDAGVVFLEVSAPDPE